MITGGFVKARPFLELMEPLNKQWTPFVKERDLRMDPRSAYDQVESIWVQVFPYALPELHEEMKHPYRVSATAFGADYHQLVARRLNVRLQQWKEKHPLLEGVVQVDTGPGVERHLADLAGLGYHGKNHFLIHPHFGTRVFIGTIYLNQVLEEERERVPKDSCGECRRCIDACPTGALTEEGLDVKVCLSYLTQKKGILTGEEMALFDTGVYGCDRCQQVCPKNWLEIDDPIMGPKMGLLEPMELLLMSQRQLISRYGSHAFSWVGVTSLQRNVLIAALKHQDTRWPLFREVAQALGKPPLDAVIRWSHEILQNR